MARRSNKTSHVLSLLTDPKSSEPAAEESTAISPEAEAAPTEADKTAQHPAADSTDPTTAAVPDPVAETKAAPSKPKQPSPPEQAPPACVSPMATLIDNSQTLEERISQQIQNSLAAQLAEEEAKDALRAEQDRKIAEQLAAKTDDLSPDAQAAPESEAQAESLPPEESSEPADTSLAGSEPKPDFELVNVMESILNGFQTEFMKKLNMCTCQRCWLDAHALTLSSLSGKYVVLDCDSVEPMLNFYDHKYRGAIMAQLTKACMTVMENPHH